MASREDERAIESYERRMERENEPEDRSEKYYCACCDEEIDTRNDDWTVMGWSIYCGKCVENGWNDINKLKHVH